MNAHMSDRWRNTDALALCGDRVIPSWKIRQMQWQQRRDGVKGLWGVFGVAVCTVVLLEIARML